MGGHVVSWVRLDDSFYTHEKRWMIDLDGIGLWALCLCYAAHKLTDGFVPEKFVRSNLPHPDRRGTLQSLLDAGMLVQADGGFAITSYLSFNPSREEVLERREKRANAGKLGAEKRWGDSKTHSNSHSTTYGSPDSNDSAPYPVTPIGETSNDVSVERGLDRRIFEYWQERCSKPSAKFVPKRRAAVKARLKEGYSEADICQAIDGASRAAYVNPDSGLIYNDLELICRNGPKLESFMSRAQGPSSQGAPQRQQPGLIRRRGCERCDFTGFIEVLEDGVRKNTRCGCMSHGGGQAA